MRFLNAVTFCAFSVATLFPALSQALKVGDRISQARLRDGSNRPATIPDLGKKVLIIYYTDPDVKDLNRPMRQLTKNAGLDRSQVRGIGVANMADTWLPDFVVRRAVRAKVREYKAVILTDPDHILRKRWQLGDCNDKDIAIVIGKDRRVKFVHDGSALKPAAQKKLLKLIKRVMAEPAPAAPKIGMLP